MRNTQQSSVLGAISKEALRGYVASCGKYAVLDPDRIYDLTLSCIQDHDGKAVDPGAVAEMSALKDRWYRSLSEGEPDYSVYASPYYFCELWLCWVKYSRPYLRVVQAETSLFTRSVVSDMRDVGTVLDLGCGAGYTTGALKEIFPDAEVFGTNMGGTSQYRMAAEMGDRLGFSVVERPQEVKADLVFASEYFEHIARPIEHLADVIHGCRPKYLLIANSFNADAIGHFDKYLHLNGSYDGSHMGRMFAAAMKFFGYSKVKTRCWNGRPTYWRRNR